MDPSYLEAQVRLDDTPYQSTDADMKYNASLLLNPKAALRAPSRPDKSPKRSRSPSTASTLKAFANGALKTSDAVEGTGAGNGGDAPPTTNVAGMIENMHNVSERQHHRQKRAKLDEDQPKATGSFQGGKGSVISDHLRTAEAESAYSAPVKDMGSPVHDGPQALREDATEKAEFAAGHQRASAASTAANHEVVELSDDEDEQPSINAENVVDLTNDADVQEPRESAPVCLGRLDRATVNCNQIPHPSPNATQFTAKNWPPIKCTLLRNRSRGTEILVKDAMGKVFGRLDARVSNALAPILDSTLMKLKLEARLPLRKRGEYELAGRRVSSNLEIQLILYAPRDRAQAVGTYLSQRNVFLQHPGSYRLTTEYCNPHDKRQDFTPSKTRPAYTVSSSTRTAEETAADLSGIFESVQAADNLPEVEPGPLVKTEMLSHQKQALHFLRTHEDHSSPEDTSLWKADRKPNGTRFWRNIITDQELSAAPKPCRGGILADVMGLGKTLAILALTVSSLDKANNFAQSNLFEGKRAIRATLLICPKSVVGNWQDQIATHLKDDLLSVYVYHGSNRRSDYDQFAQQDVIITTYQTVGAEFFSRNEAVRAKSPFHQLAFFRICLDEAHTIRSPSANVSKAACNVTAERRWAITGTPIQNRLDDLGSLLRFLRIPPFEDYHWFSTFVLTPFKMADTNILVKLRLLVNSITLRRTKERLNLPVRQDVEVKLEFTKEERQIYDAFAKDGQNRLKAMSTKKEKLAGRTYAHVLRSILMLRLLAAGGKDLLNTDDLDALRGLSLSTAIDLEEEEQVKPAIDTRTAYEICTLCQETDTFICARCTNRLRHVETSDEEVLGYVLSCFHFVCDECEPDFRNTMEEQSQDGRFKCLYCNDWIPAVMLELTQDGFKKAQRDKEELRANPRMAKMIERYTSPNTKTKALIASLQEVRERNQRNPEEPPEKSVVFSSWTTNLDLIELGLSEDNFKFVRLDGKKSFAQRKEALEAFHSDPTVEVFLASLGAGGVGINLTAANRVFMMEPQFNPGAEAQAIDRVHRLGQTREVTCTRFIMDHSIEEAIMLLQEKKKDLAEISLGKGKMDRAEATKQRLEGLRALFR